MRRMLPVAVGLTCLAIQAVGAASLAGRVMATTAAGAVAARGVVYAEPLGERAPSRPIKVRLRQKDKTFAPPILAVPVGSTVEFPNDDPIFHNVFSLQSPEPFDLGLYRAGESKPRVFSQPGSYRVFCNIHPQMTALIVVAPTPYVTVTAADGTYSLELPSGSYRVTARSERATPVSVEITIGAGAGAVPDLTLDESRFVSVHKNKFGQDYPASAYTQK